MDQLTEQRGFAGCGDVDRILSLVATTQDDDKNGCDTAAAKYVERMNKILGDLR